MTIRPLRSALYLPANRASAVEKARRADCDAVILDLEDAVAPEAKVDARAAAVAAVNEGGFGHRILVVRVNALDTEWGPADITALAGCGPDAVLVPKLCHPDEAGIYRQQLGTGPELWAMLETCIAFTQLSAISAKAAAAELTTYVMGTNDLALEMRAKLDTARAPFQPVLAQAVINARAYGLSVLDGVFNDIGDEEGLATQCREGADMGFDGKTLIHPKQLAIANAAFSPSAAEVRTAQSIRDAFAAPENAGKGVIKVGGRMTEILHLREAERTLALHAATQRNPS
ncbi:CoA ester lyase [Pontixanthobacter aestiaquae]|uniref:CoA ester lyase n=1 Tax=Pontixanthobacter aestiaquae TaxID=1509367 RepID=A0A844ZEK8_9SPHN|nr:CoA ester lyase [Pontixanthobacter aestiaquae]MDN3644804.1 CoA ester lyase [Pontixanthobacter aestiaquae]MXO84189.1 CoA ester lyase [Pontixanthobacter aestiaquae]